MREDRFVRLLDLQPHEIIVVRCQCGRSAEYGYGLLQRLHRLPSDTLVYDLQFKLHCRQCNRRTSFEIGILDGRPRSDRRSEEQPYELQSLMSISYAVSCLIK